MKDADKKLVKYKLKENARQTALEELGRSASRLSVPVFILLMFVSYGVAIIINGVEVKLWMIASICMLVGIGAVSIWTLVSLGMLLVAYDKYKELERKKK